MAWTDNESQRISMIEEVINDMQVAMKKFMTKQQLQALLLIKQTEIDSLTNRVTALESQLAILQAKI